MPLPAPIPVVLPPEELTAELGGLVLPVLVEPDPVAAEPVLVPEPVAPALVVKPVLLAEPVRGLAELVVPAPGVLVPVEPVVPLPAPVPLWCRRRNSRWSWGG